MRFWDWLKNPFGRVEIPQSYVVVSCDRETLRLRKSPHPEIELSWSDLTEVSIETNDLGPFLDDVFAVLRFQDDCYRIAEFRPALPFLLQLPGFDGEAFSRSMASTENASFHCWPPRDAEGTPPPEAENHDP